jgi:hypothetical protein
MANQLYPKFLTRLLGAYLGAETPAVDPTFKIYLLSQAYFFQESHETLADLTGIVGDPVTLTNVTVDDSGTVFADDVIGAFADTGETQIASFVVTVDGKLVAFFNEGKLSTLPVVGGGLETNILWNESGIFRA